MKNSRFGVKSCEGRMEMFRTEISPTGKTSDINTIHVRLYHLGIDMTYLMKGILPPATCFMACFCALVWSDSQVNHEGQVIGMSVKSIISWRIQNFMMKSWLSYVGVDLLAQKVNFWISRAFYKHAKFWPVTVVDMWRMHSSFFRGLDRSNTLSVACASSTSLMVYKLTSCTVPLRIVHKTCTAVKASLSRCAYIWNCAGSVGAVGNTGCYDCGFQCSCWFESSDGHTCRQVLGRSAVSG